MKKALLEAFLIGLAGFFGAMSRYGVSTLLNREMLPYGTLLINIVGSVALGWLMAASENRDFISPLTRTVIAVGFIGTFTTFSSWMFESDGMLRHGAFLRAGAYIIGSVALGLLAVRAGWLLGRRM